MKHLDAQEIKMSSTKHLPFQKFEAIDMPFHDAVVPRKPTSRLCYLSKRLAALCQKIGRISQAQFC